jgi:NADP-dependent 3-hydroxy acid dehydrogenase YdfG
MMSNASNSPRTWLITGCSSGFGLELASQLLHAGERVVATARKIETVAPLVAHYPERGLALTLDVTNAAQARVAAEAAEARFGAVDVLINNAGFAFIGGVEAVSEDEYRAVFETNFFGALQMVQAVMPGMRKRRRGHIVNLSSISAIAPSPGLAFYSASKRALGSITEGIASEGADVGIRATAIEAGIHRTQVMTSARRAERSIPDYTSVVAAEERIMSSSSSRIGSAELAAQAIIAAVMNDNPPLFLQLGEDALMRKFDIARRTIAESEKWADVALSTLEPEIAVR